MSCSAVLRFLQLLGNVQAAYLRIGAVRAGGAARTVRFRLAVVRAVCACLVAVIFLLPTIGAATAESKRVMLLHSFGRRIQALERICQNNPLGTRPAITLAAGHH